MFTLLILKSPYSSRLVLLIINIKFLFGFFFQKNETNILRLALRERQGVEGLNWPSEGPVTQEPLESFGRNVNYLGKVTHDTLTPSVWSDFNNK